MRGDFDEVLRKQLIHTRIAIFSYGT
jgi:hypothetical protein